MSFFVLDASIALSWFIDHPVASRAVRVRKMILNGHHAVVPSLWNLEIVNGLLVAERRGLRTPDDTTLALQNMEIMMGQGIEVRPEAFRMRKISQTTRRFQLTAYDAAYLELAVELQCGLATLDEQLAKSAIKAGVQVV